MVKHADIILYYIFFGGIFREVTKTKFSNKNSRIKEEIEGLKEKGIKQRKRKRYQDCDCVRGTLCYLICSRHLIRSKVVTNQILFLRKALLFAIMSIGSLFQ